MESIAHELKKTIGTGGTAKNGMIVLQGDHRSKVTEFLLTKGYPREAIEVIWLRIHIYNPMIFFIIWLLPR